MAPRTTTNGKPEFIQLSKVTGSDRSTRNHYNDSDEDTGQVIGTTPTTPVIVAVDSIRCYNARKNNAPGTRITFKDGGGFAVLQTMDAIKAVIGYDVPVVEVAAAVELTAEAVAESVAPRLVS